MSNAAQSAVTEDKDQRWQREKHSRKGLGHFVLRAFVDINSEKSIDIVCFN